MSELIDLVDRTGTVVLKRISRTNTNLHPYLFMQIVIGVIFNSAGEVLVHKRSTKKKVNPGDIDHVCGGIRSGESATDAFVREAKEETGITPTDIRTVHKGINSYRKYRHLLVGFTDDAPSVQDIHEVEWTKFVTPKFLKEAKENKSLTFVDEFFDDLAIAQKAIKQIF